MVYGGIGRAARDWSASTASSVLQRLEDDETLLVQSGKPVGVFRTHADAPRVLIANSNLVPHWATWEHFNELDRKGLMMYGQMTAGSWIYIGSQGIVQGTYETFVEAGRPAFRRRPRRAAGSSPAAWAAWAARSRWPPPWPAPRCLAVECRRDRIDFRLETRYLDRKATSLDEALAMLESGARPAGRPSRWAARQRRRGLPRAARARACPTSSPTRPAPTTRSTATCRGLDVGGVARRARSTRPGGGRARRPSARWRSRCEAMSGSTAPAWPTLDYGNNIRQMAKGRGSVTPSTSRASSRPTSAPVLPSGIGPFRWAALSGNPRTSTRPTPR